MASRIQEYPPASVAGLMVRFGRAEFQRQLFHRIEGNPVPPRTPEAYEEQAGGVLSER